MNSCFLSLFFWRDYEVRAPRKKCPIWSYSGLYFPAFGLNTKKYGVSLRIRSECGKMRTRINPHTNTSHTVVKVRVKKSSFYQEQPYIT